MNYLRRNVEHFGVFFYPDKLSAAPDARDARATAPHTVIKYRIALVRVCANQILAQLDRFLRLAFCLAWVRLSKSYYARRVFLRRTFPLVIKGVKCAVVAICHRLNNCQLSTNQRSISISSSSSSSTSLYFCESWVGVSTKGLSEKLESSIFPFSREGIPSSLPVSTFLPLGLEAA